MAEIIITIENLRKIIQGLKAKGTDKVRVSIIGEWLYVEDLKTGERIDVRSQEAATTEKPSVGADYKFWKRYSSRTYGKPQMTRRR